MGFLVGALALVLAEMRIAGLSVVLMGVGIFLTAAARDLIELIGASLVMSVGFHFFYTSNASAVLLTVGPDEAPKVLGRLNSLGALAAVMSTLLIFGTLDAWGYRTLFHVGGAVVVIGGLVLLPFNQQSVRAKRTGRRPPLSRRYWLYYAIGFLMGSRRHIFITFAVFFLVRKYQVTAQTITLLFLIINLVGTYSHQAFGKIVARFGERRVLTVNFMLLALVFLGYALIPTLDALERPTCHAGITDPAGAVRDGSHPLRLFHRPAVLPPKGRSWAGGDHAEHLFGADHQTHCGSDRAGGGRGGVGGGGSAVHLHGGGCHRAAVAGADAAHAHATARADQGPLPDPVTLEPVRRRRKSPAWS
jgi:MFS family permease